MKALLACTAAALFVASGADATVSKQTYHGYVADTDPTYTTDYDNLFGGGNLAGASFTATYLWDDTLGTTTVDATSYDLYGYKDPFDPAPPPTPNLFTSLTINGHTYAYSTAQFAELYLYYPNYASEVASNTWIDNYQLALGLYSNTPNAPWVTSPWNFTGLVPPATSGGTFFSPHDELHLTATSYSIGPVTIAALEPASWAMMLGGFGLVGAAMRRRRGTAVSFG